MFSKQKKEMTVLHFDNPFESYENQEIIEREIEEMKKTCNGKITFQTDKKTGYKKLIIVCEGKPILNE